MRRDPLFTSWVVRCPSEEAAQQLTKRVNEIADPDATVMDLVRAFPDGLESVRKVPHRLADYFQGIRLLPGPPGVPSCFRLLFHRREDAGRFWKDLMVQVLQDLRNLSGDVTATLDYRGDSEPSETDEPRP